MADVATLAVALHLNSASFKSQIVDSFKTAESASKNFTGKAQQESQKTTDALTQIGNQAKRTGGQLNTLSGALNASQGGFEQLRTVISGLAGGSNIAVSTLANALIPTLDRTFTGFKGLSSGWEAQREAAKDAAVEFKKASQGQIEQAQSARQQAQAQFEAAKRTREQAQASREQAQEMARFYAAKTQENQLYGLSVSYQKEYADINRQVREANIAEVGAKGKMAQASKAVLAADIAEAQGKTNLLSSLTQISAANKEVSFSARAAAASTNLLKSAMALLGGPVGLGIMAAVAGATALYTAYQNAEAETKGFNAALQKSGNQAIMTVNDLQLLTLTLGSTQNAVKAVTSAAGAGFGGDMLTEVASLGTRMNELGMSSDDLVTQLSSLKGEPLKALEALTNQGVQLNTTFIDHIATLSRQGKTSEATALLQQKYLDDVKGKVTEQENSVGGLKSVWKSLKNEVASAFDIISQAQMKTAQAQALAQGVKLDISNAPAEELKKTADELYKRQQREQEAARQELKLQNEVAAAIKAGADPKKEQIRLTAELTKLRSQGRLTAEEYAQALKGINKQYGEKSKATYSDSEGVRRLQQLREQSAVLRAQAQDTDKLSDAQKKLVAFDQEIAGLQGKKLTTGQKSLLSMQDQIRAQLTENAALEKANREREIGKKLLEQTRSMVIETAAKQQEYANQNAQMTLSTAAYDQMVAEQQIRESFHQRRLQLNKEVTDKASEQYVQQTAILASEQQRQLDIVRNAAQEKAAIEGDYSAGLKKGMTDWAADAGNVYGQVKDVTGRTFDGMASTLTNFVTTGKASFGDFAKSVLTDLSSMLIKMAMFNALKAGMSFFSPGGNDPGQVPMFANAKGGVYSSPSLSSYSGQVVSQPTMFAFAKGAGLMGEAGPEAIMPLKRGADGSLGVRAMGAPQQTAAAPNVYITIEGGGNVSTQADPGWEEFGKQIGNIAAQESQKVINRNLKPGQPIWKAIKGM
ncbi:Phage-related minor tail protein [Serratia liquefaciens]|uniref:phage tail tape measure protein n=1 Tax=Serratia liquefaciens TaxID=614 RepID=UPI00217B2AC0|nr:phage tail tape measure protein [Serratia liquefaciens]CAI1039501.1 Phage-related minor tail protein [Serratia liquefaciens]CAI1542139.1 Phage-related minor tail protein [Serratia liquefaciens]